MRAFAKELRRPFYSKELLKLNAPVLRLKVRLKHIEGFTVAMLKSYTDGVLFLMLAWWNY